MLAEPAIDRLPDQGEDPPVDGRMSEVMVLFLDDTSRLCRVAEWNRIGDRWPCHLAWGVLGKIQDAWFVYDPERMAPLDSV